VRVSGHGGRERRVTVSRAVPELRGRHLTRAQVRRFARLGAAVAGWAAVTYVAAVAANRRLGLRFTESPADGEFQLVLMACGTLVWVVLGVPLVLGALAFRALTERTRARVVAGTVVFRGELDPRRSIDDDRRPEYYVAIDDGTSDRVPAYLCSWSTAAHAREGDVVRASVTPTGRLLHLVLLAEAPAP